MHATGLTDLVGREEELELLLRRWSNAKTGEGQVVLLSGEAWNWQVSTDGSTAGTSCCGAAHALALFLLPAAHGQRVLSRSSARWNVPLDLRMTTPPKRSSTNSTPC